MDAENYIPTAEYCYIINKSYCCTDDENLANAYLSIKRVAEMSDDSDMWLFSLADILVNLKRYATAKGILEDVLYLDVVQRLRQAVESYHKNPEDRGTIREKVLSALTDIRRL